MCDYSLEGQQNRNARVKDRLYIQEFSSGSRGFAAHGDPDCAVCLKPGTVVLLSDIPDAFREVHHVTSLEFADFEQRERSSGYRDGIRLRETSNFVLLKNMPRGVSAIVFWIPGEMPEGATMDGALQDLKQELVDA